MQERGEGYFRLEWKLAVERTHLMAEGIPFLAPVTINKAHEADALVPPEFMRVHWTRLAEGTPTPDFVEQIKRLLEGPRKSTATRKSESAGPQFPAPSATPPRSAAPAAPAATKSGLPLWATATLGAVVLGLIAYIALRPAAKEIPVSAPAQPVAEKKSASSAAPAPQADDKSVAVLAFTDLSEGRNSEYFSDGISEDLLDVLAKVPGLRVAARTSAFFFKARISRFLKSPRNSTSPTWSRAACSARATTCASPRSSSRRPTATTCGPSISTAS